MIGDLIHAFYHYDYKELNKYFFKLREAPHESIAQFWDDFFNLTFQVPWDEIDWKFLKERFQYLLHVFENLNELESFNPLPTYLVVRASISKTNKVAITSDPMLGP